jgi:hypothetical protein
MTCRFEDEEEPFLCQIFCFSMTPGKRLIRREEIRRSGLMSTITFLECKIVDAKDY